MIGSPSNPATTAPTQTASYFGIEVTVVAQMEHCSLIHYGEVAVVVDSADLVLAKAMKRAA